MKFVQKSVIDNNVIKSLAKSCNVSEFLARLLVMRNVDTPQKVQKFLYGKLSDLKSPFDFDDMDKVTERIKFAINSNEKILIYGDYDCDGVGAISILYLAMKDNGTIAEYYIPTRHKEGYGLNCDAIKTIKDTVNPNLIITVDCGINSVKEIAYAKSLGIDVIVTDHHQPGEILPDCLILNPLLSNTTPYCGAGVAFTLVRALYGDNVAFKYIDICAMSTVADIVPLIDDNRLIVKYGLEAIRKGRCRIGFKELIYYSKIDIRNITTSDIGFKIAPRINAAGRLKSALLALSLFIEEDTTSLRLISEELSMLNQMRQTMNNEIFDEAIAMLKEYDFSKYKIIILSGKWSEGVVGIVCAKIAEYFNLPTILLCETEGTDVLKGSARGIQGVNLFELFDKNNENLVGYGGHAMAAGISLKKQDYEKVLNTFNDYLINRYDSSVFEKQISYDMELPIHEVNQSLCSEFSLLEPFGHTNPVPVFIDRTSELKFKRISKTSHIKAKSYVGDVLAFDKYKYVDLLSSNRATILYTIEKNIFNGRVSTQFMVKNAYFDIESVSNDVVLNNYCETFLPYNEDSTELKTVSKEPILYVSYDANLVKEFVANNPNYNLIMYNTDKIEIRDTIVFAPDKDFPFLYFKKIIFLEKVGDGLADMLTRKGISYEIKGENTMLANAITIDELRELYIVLRNSVNHSGIKFCTTRAYFEDVLHKLPTKLQDVRKFFIGCFVLRELALINVSNDGIITIDNKKVDLGQSQLLRMV